MANVTPRSAEPTIDAQGTLPEPTASPMERSAAERGPDSSPTAPSTAAQHHEQPAGFLSAAPARRPFESVLVRVVATVGVIAIGTLLGALLVANDVAGWIVGLTVSAVSVVLAAILWRSREL